MITTRDTGIIFNMQAYSVHDGPGIRTLVFLKGCPLSCAWCCNPESQSLKLELGYNKSKCLLCARCVTACLNKALEITSEGISIDREKCVQCGACTKICPSKAVIMYGSSMTAKEVLDKVEQDSAFYARSGGGMTLSGGEVFSQFEFLMSLLKEAEKRAIHTAIETCGFVKEENLLKAAELLDYLLYDIKHTDSEKHKEGTGQDCTIIMNNIRKVREKFPSLPVHIRTPIIPNFNDSVEVVESIAKFAKEIGAKKYELLAYHKMGEQKYGYLNREYKMPDDKLEPEYFDKLKSVVEKYFPEDSTSRSSESAVIF